MALLKELAARPPSNWQQELKRVPYVGQITRNRFCAQLLVPLLALAAIAPAEAATIYYVRSDGGDAGQCTGKSDAAYPGRGNSQACAWQHPHHALPPEGRARLKGGDTLIIGPGSYKIAWGAPGARGGRCDGGARYDCHLAPIPSGPDANAKTRILGWGFDSGCKQPPTLWGSERVSAVLNLKGSANVEIGCLEITDHSDCVEDHSNSAARCQRDQAPYGDWASVGLAASDSRNVWLHDLNIHGLAHTGIQAGGLIDWTVERVKINANGWVGWDGDIGDDSSNAGRIVLRNVEIAWNGCGQRWQTGDIHGCWAQEEGGYGDGLGTARTGGRWLIEDSRIHHNTSDGLDLLYLDGAAGTSVTVRRVWAVGNAGNQLKTTGAATIENSIVVGQCAFFNHRFDMSDGNQCRAMGNALSIGLIAGQTATIRHNTIIGEGDCLILTEGGTSTSKVVIQNNVLLGQRAFSGGDDELSCGHHAENSPAQVSFSGNAFWNVKNDQCPPGNLCGQNPLLTDMDMASFNAMPLPRSPLIDKAPELDAITVDFRGTPRPAGAAADIGAIEAPAK